MKLIIYRTLFIFFLIVVLRTFGSGCLTANQVSSESSPSISIPAPVSGLVSSGADTSSLVPVPGDEVTVYLPNRGLVCGSATTDESGEYAVNCDFRRAGQYLVAVDAAQTGSALGQLTVTTGTEGLRLDVTALTESVTELIIDAIKLLGAFIESDDGLIENIFDYMIEQGLRIDQLHDGNIFCNFLIDLHTMDSARDIQNPKEAYLANRVNSILEVMDAAIAAGHNQVELFEQLLAGDGTTLCEFAESPEECLGIIQNWAEDLRKVNQVSRFVSQFHNPDDGDDEGAEVDEVLCDKIEVPYLAERTGRILNTFPNVDFLEDTFGSKASDETRGRNIGRLNRIIDFDRGQEILDEERHESSALVAGVILEISSREAGDGEDEDGELAEPTAEDVRVLQETIPDNSSLADVSNYGRIGTALISEGVSAEEAGVRAEEGVILLREAIAQAAEELGLDGDSSLNLSCYDTAAQEVKADCEYSCNDEIDNDGDTFADCDDPDCYTSPFCLGAELCTNGTDDDGDGDTDCADANCAGSSCDENGFVCARSDCVCALEEDDTGEVTCSDDQDNDCDGDGDCADAQCNGRTCNTSTGVVCTNGACPSCVATEQNETTCNDGEDDDCDGKTDCADSDCNGDACGANGRTCANNACSCPGGQVNEATCNDGLDNDCDGLTDCLDNNCVLDANCIENNCLDNLDNDGDGMVDCADVECNNDACNNFGSLCQGGFCTCPGGNAENDCDDAEDNDCDGLTDCADTITCMGQTCLPNDFVCNVNGQCVCDNGGVEMNNCADLIDNDCDGTMDCNDGADCAADPACGGGAPENCSNFVDDDGDLLVDCNDPDCAGQPGCF